MFAEDRGFVDLNEVQASLAVPSSTVENFSGNQTPAVVWLARESDIPETRKTRSSNRVGPRRRENPSPSQSVLAGYGRRWQGCLSDTGPDARRKRCRAYGPGRNHQCAAHAINCRNGFSLACGNDAGWR